MGEIPVIIRKYGTGDFSAACSLEAGQKRTGYGAAVFVRQAAAVCPATFFVAECDGAVVGYSVGEQVQGNPWEAWILRLAVREECRGRGIGTKLTEALTEALRNAGARTILLTVAPANAPAISIYRSLGFVPVRHCPDYFGKGEDRDVMQLQLPAA